MIQLLHHLEQLIVDDKRDNITRLMDLAECDQALRAAIKHANWQPRYTLEHAFDQVAADRAMRITAMATTIAAGIWARNDPDLNLGDASSKTIVAKLARETAELILTGER